MDMTRRAQSCGLALAASSALLLAPPSFAQVSGGCSYNGINLWGDVQAVESFPDIKVQVVTSFPDLRVEQVTSFPDDCGQWRMVNSFPDFTVQFVDSFPDIQIEYVTSFPGVP